MSLAYWCVLVAAILPHLTVALAKRIGPYDNADPRNLRFEGLAARAHAAHQNGFEAFPLFAIAVLVASGASPHVSNPVLDTLAIVWLVLRIGYVGAYLADLASFRSLVWTLGFATAAAIFTMPAWHA